MITTTSWPAQESWIDHVAFRLFRVPHSGVLTKNTGLAVRKGGFTSSGLVLGIPLALDSPKAPTQG